MNARNYLFGGNNYDLYLIEREELPISGSFEVVIEADDQFIGFIRGNKKDIIISFNLIFIVEEYRRKGIGTDIYEKLLNKGYIMKSDSEITDNTYSIYYNLVNYNDYTPLIFNDGSVGIKNKK